jgi:hypothetical protein
VFWVDEEDWFVYEDDEFGLLELVELIPDGV